MTDPIFAKPSTALADSEEAVQNFVGEHFLEWLLEYTTQQVKLWPELKEIRDSRPPKIEKLKKFVLQRFLAAEAFLGGREGDPGFLGFAIANLSESPDPLAENALGILELKRKEELGEEHSGNQNQHRELWLKLLTALGMADEEIKRAEPKDMTRRYIAELSDVFSTSEWQTAMGAFLAHERMIPEEYSAIQAMLKQNAALTADDLAVFTWHAGVDLKYVINTKHMLEKIVYDPESKQLVLDGVLKQLSARQALYRHLMKYLK